MISIVGILDNNLSEALSITYINRDIIMMLITTLGFYIIIKNYNKYITNIVVLGITAFFYVLPV